MSIRAEPHRDEHTREAAQSRSYARTSRRDEHTRGAVQRRAYARSRTETSIRADLAQRRVYARVSCRAECARGSRAAPSIRAEPCRDEHTGGAVQ